MKLTWKSRTLIEIRWPWMSRKRHEEIVRSFQDQIASMDKAQNVVIDSMNKHHADDLESERKKVREALKKLNAYQTFGHRDEHQPCFVLQATVDYRAVQWAYGCGDMQVAQLIIDQMCHELSDHMRCLVRSKGLVPFLDELDRKHTKEQREREKRFRKEIFNPITDQKPPTP
jgi:hypothetical protein